MKHIPILLLFFALHDTFAIAQNITATDYTPVSTFRIGENKITLEEKKDSKVFRENQDHVKFYKTILAAMIESKNRQILKIFDTALYITDAYHKTMLPCVLVDTVVKVMYVFSNSKAPDIFFGMDGYVYRSDMEVDSVQKETIFKEFNAGWSSFFGGSFSGNPELWHYSAAGGLVILSKRRGDNKWSNDVVGRIDPSLVEKQYGTHKNVLFASLPNIDSMKFL
ncbi:MAG: hypothetical protein PW786_06225 [Arachidicoccus sp.]|nr:hypothetical protein [Arachidicoccus sp.]